MSSSSIVIPGEYGSILLENDETIPDECDEYSMQAWMDGGWWVDEVACDGFVWGEEADCQTGVFVCRDGGNQREVCWEEAQGSWCEMSSALLWADMEPMEVVERMPLVTPPKMRWADIEDEEEDWDCGFECCFAQGYFLQALQEW